MGGHDEQKEDHNGEQDLETDIGPPNVCFYLGRLQQQAEPGRVDEACEEQSRCMPSKADDEQK